MTSAPSPIPAGRGTAWRIAGGFFLLLGTATLLYGIGRLIRPNAAVFFTEAPILVSTTQYLQEGTLKALYPPGRWSEPPMVLTLYTPLFHILSAQAATFLSGPGTLLPLRALSFGALVGVVTMVLELGRRRRSPWPWATVLLGAALVSPGVLRLAGSAQPDVLALFWSLAGLAVLGVGAGRGGDRVEPGLGRFALALVCFLAAVYTKQSFVAAPLAAVVGTALAKRPGRALLLGGVFAAGVLTVGGALQLATGGGFTDHTFLPLATETSWAGAVRVLARSGPLHWGALALLVLAVTWGRLRPGIAEAYVCAAFLVHLPALLKVGADINYFLEPVFALVLLGMVRHPAGGERTGPGRPDGEDTVDAAARARPPLGWGRLWLVPAALAGLAVASLSVAGTAIDGVESVYGRSEVSALPALPDPGGGHPLTTADAFPRLVAGGTLPYLNDPLVFGELRERGVWDPGPLVVDLRARRVPFVLTSANLEVGPAPPDARTAELQFLYFWRMPEVRRAILDHYRLLSRGPVYFLWIPRSSGREADESRGARRPVGRHRDRKSLPARRTQPEVPRTGRRRRQRQPASGAAARSRSLGRVTRARQ